LKIRDASAADARELAYLINLAGEGIPAYLWQSQAENGESPLAVGIRRAARPQGGFSYRHARVCVEAGRILGMLLAYPLPDPCETVDPDNYPALVVPLLELETGVPGSWYLNGIATLEDCRGRGIGRMLMLDSVQRARYAGCHQVSLIVASHNAQARRLYESLGFVERARRPLIPWPGSPPGGDWILMTREI